MATTVVFTNHPTNLDYLMPRVRVALGDLTGDQYSDPLVRSSLVYGVIQLQSRWQSRYQVFWQDLVLDPQPPAVPSGYIAANTAYGVADIPSGLAEGSVFRNPFMHFEQPAPPTIQGTDEGIIVLAATAILLQSQYTSSAASFVSWSTEDIRYSNLGSQRGLSELLTRALNDIDLYFRAGIGNAQIGYFAPLVLAQQFYEGLNEVQG